MTRLIIPAVMAMLMALGCGPVLSTQVISEVDPTVGFPQLLEQPDRYGGRMVLVGGRIIQTTVGEGETWVEVLQLPLGLRDKPRDTDASLGRFLVRYPDFRDPAVYVRGAMITVAGMVKGSRSLPLGETRYVYPVIEHRESHLWSPEVGYPPRFMIGVGVGAVIR